MLLCADNHAFEVSIQYFESHLPYLEHQSVEQMLGELFNHFVEEGIVKSVVLAGYPLVKVLKQPVTLL